MNGLQPAAAGELDTIPVPSVPWPIPCQPNQNPARNTDDIEFVLGLAPQLVAVEAPPWRDSWQMTETDTHVLRRALEAPSDGVAVFIALDPDDEKLGFIHVCVETDYYTRGPCGHIADLRSLASREVRV